MFPIGGWSRDLYEHLADTISAEYHVIDGLFCESHPATVRFQPSFSSGCGAIMESFRALSEQYFGSPLAEMGRELRYTAWFMVDGHTLTVDTTPRGLVARGACSVGFSAVSA